MPNLERTTSFWNNLYQVGW